MNLSNPKTDVPHIAKCSQAFKFYHMPDNVINKKQDTHHQNR